MSLHPESDTGLQTLAPSDPNAVQSRIKALFAEASELPPTEREPLLAASCGHDLEFRQQVESLLAAYDRAGDFLAGPSSNASRMSARIGEMVGRYKLLQEIGEGGFGTVFMAEQQQPVSRKVAVKIIKLGMDSRQVIARFEAERQALAIMDHPHIARVLDGGCTESGQPYFVMELVEGEPITEYADHNHLTVTQRIELFGQVCQAVQHAHQKGIIHRDIKPNNVLVSTQDDRPFARVIDFGIAKAMAARLTEKTLFTEFKQLIGTPQYMSPEQADASLDIDTRTDVYSLGVLLYELLTGTTPFDARTLRSAAYDEMRRIIREVEPPRPSTRLSESAGTLSAVAAMRKVEPGKLGGQVRGELDWIVMKALEKDRARRYESASDLAADLNRHLSDDVVNARPPSAAYRLSKIFRRHKVAMVTSATIAATILAALVISTVMYRRERTERQQAELARQGEQTQRQQAEANYGVAREAVDHLTDIAQTRLLDTTDLASVRRDMLEDAAKFYGAFMQSRGDDPGLAMQAAASQMRAGILLYSIGQPRDAQQHERQSVSILETLSNAHPDRKEYRAKLGDACIDLGRLYNFELMDPIAAEQTYLHAKDVLRPVEHFSVGGEDGTSSAFWARYELATLYLHTERFQDANAQLQEAAALVQEITPFDQARNDFFVAKLDFSEGECAGRTGDDALAETKYRACIALREKMHAGNAQDEGVIYDYNDTKGVLANLLIAMSRPKEAEALLRQCIAELDPLARSKPAYPWMSTLSADMYTTLGTCLLTEGRTAEAHDSYVVARDVLRRLYETHTDAPSRAIAPLFLLAACPDATVRDPAAAVGIARGALEKSPRTQQLWFYLGTALYQTGNYKEAISALDNARQIGPRDLDFARYVLAMAQYRDGQVDLARATFADAQRWDASTPKYYREPRQTFAREASQTILGALPSIEPSTVPTITPTIPLHSPP